MKIYEFLFLKSKMEKCMNYKSLQKMNLCWMRLFLQEIIIPYYFNEILAYFSTGCEI